MEDTFGSRLIEIRKKANISQEELAELLDVSRQSISKWENDKAYPEMTRLIFISDYFGVSLDYLMRGEENTESVKPEKIAEDKNRSLLRMWNDFTSNLSSNQKQLLTILIVALIFLVTGISMSLFYSAGHALGELLRKLVG
ncbi:MAG: helix-turn-helix transcriptional regulator [Eubacteriales bacterium]|nr:helix-turn-helix transcriptional regulator [Eubacteriales bacterium]